MRRWATAALLGAALAGCATLKVAPPSPEASVALPERADLFRALAARREAIHAVRALARMSYTSGTESRRTRQVVLAERPDRLRLEVLSPFGTVFLLTADRGRLGAYVPDEHAVYRGAASADNLARYTQVDVPVSTAVDLILGTPPMDEGRDGVVSRDEGLVQLWQDAGNSVVRVAWFTSRLEPVRWEQRDADGLVLVRARFDAIAEIGGVRLPTQVQVELPSSAQRIDIALGEPEVNPVLADALFDLETPSGAREISLDALER
jgi:outer membrane lipoprotein-sorting protein